MVRDIAGTEPPTGEPRGQALGADLAGRTSVKGEHAFRSGGTQAYTYDAWNRLKTVAHAYGDGSNVHPGQPFAKMLYDASGRRIMKVIGDTNMLAENSGTQHLRSTSFSMDGTTHYYLSGNSVAETRNGSDQLLEQFVHSISYIDELVQVGVNTYPPGQPYCDYFLWYCQDANYNVLGLYAPDYGLQERYEYSAYGQRQIFYSPGSNDPGCYAPAGVSSFGWTGLTPLNDFGHQGLLHDEETGLVYSRGRFLNPPLGRWNQEDPLGYVDGMNVYAAEGDNPTKRDGIYRKTEWQNEIEMVKRPKAFRMVCKPCDKEWTGNFHSVGEIP
jgi:RHS repeat-associated protein